MCIITLSLISDYFAEGFLALQHLLSTFATLYNAGYKIPAGNSINDWSFLQTLDLPFVNMRRFPYAAWKEDLLLTPLKAFVSIIVMLSFVYPCINTVKSITTEKEKQLKVRTNIYYVSLIYTFYVYYIIYIPNNNCFKH